MQVEQVPRRGLEVVRDTRSDLGSLEDLGDLRLLLLAGQDVREAD